MSHRHLIAIALWGISIGFSAAGLLITTVGWRTFVPIAVLLIATSFGAWAGWERFP